MGRYSHYTSETIKFNPYTSIVEAPNKLPHFNDFWKITYSVNGTSFVSLNGEEITLTNTTIVFVKPGAIFQTKSYTPKNYRHRDIYVSDERMRELCEFLPVNPYDSLANTNPYITVNQINIENIEQTLNIFPLNTDTVTDYLSTLHTCVLINLLSLYVEAINAQPKIPRWLRELVDGISLEHYAQSTVADIVAKTPYSHGHICREFKKYYGITLSEYVTRAKIVYSSSLLMDKKYSITDIAYMLGFSTQSSFIKAFKAFYGNTPGKWRKQNLNDKEFSVTVKWGKSKS